MTNLVHTILTIFVASISTFLTRIIPFIAFRKNEVPEKIDYLGKILPPAIMATLIVYCVRNVDYGNFNDIMSQFLSIGVVYILHKWKKNILLSIGGGTVFYMIIIRTVFKIPII